MSCLMQWTPMYPVASGSKIDHINCTVITIHMSSYQHHSAPKHHTWQRRRQHCLSGHAILHLSASQALIDNQGGVDASALRRFIDTF